MIERFHYNEGNKKIINQITGSYATMYPFIGPISITSSIVVSVSKTTLVIKVISSFNTQK